MGKISVRPCAVVIKDNAVLCVKSTYDKETFYLFPGGGPEAGEVLAECAARETLEETNLKINIKRLLYVNDYIRDKEKDLRCLNVFFLGEIAEDAKVHNENDPCKHLDIIKEVVWIPLEEFHTIDFRPKELTLRLKKDFKDGFSGCPIYFVN